MIEQRWDLLEIYFQNKKNRSQIARKLRTRIGSQEGSTVLGICKFIANVGETGFVVGAPRRECALTPANFKAEDDSGR